MIDVRRQVTAAACLVFGVTDLFFLNSVVFPRALRRASAPALFAPPAPSPAVAVTSLRVEPIEPSPPSAPPAPSPPLPQTAPTTATPGETIYFPSAVRRLDHLGRETIDRLTAVLNKDPRATLLIEGHTDAVGESQFNERLSRRRAVSVLAYLKQRGVPAARVVLRSYGASRPVVTGRDADSLQRNRRVELTVMGGS